MDQELERAALVALLRRGDRSWSELTWTTGNHAQPAAATLKAAGASCVAVVVLGRHLNSTYGDTATHIARAQLRSFSWNVCALQSSSHS